MICSYRILGFIRGLCLFLTHEAGLVKSITSPSEDRNYAVRRLTCIKNVPSKKPTDVTKFLSLSCSEKYIDGSWAVDRVNVSLVVLNK